MRLLIWTVARRLVYSALRRAKAAGASTVLFWQQSRSKVQYKCWHTDRFEMELNQESEIMTSCRASEWRERRQLQGSPGELFGSCDPSCKKSHMSSSIERYGTQKTIQTYAAGCAATQKNTNTLTAGSFSFTTSLRSVIRPCKYSHDPIEQIGAAARHTV